MKKILNKGISLMLVMSMTTWCLAGCGNDKETQTVSKTIHSQVDTADMEALLSEKVGSGKDADKKETVYVEMKADGTVTKTTVSNVLKTSQQENINDYSILENITNISGDEKFAQDKDGRLVWENKGESIEYQGTTEAQVPIKIHVTYYLDGKEVSPKEIAGKSGKVKMVYDYENRSDNEKGKFVPFLALTGMIMDKDVFSNVQVENGKVIDYDGAGIVVGYAAPGVKKQLLDKIDKAEKYLSDFEIPESFTVTADAKNFSMEMTLTAATSEIGDLDLEDTLDFSDLESQMNQLQDGADQLADGTNKLLRGTESLKNGSSKLNAGTKELSDGTIALSVGAGQLFHKYQTFNKALLGGIDSAKTGADQLYSGSKELESAATVLNSGAGELESAANAINSGAKELESVANVVAPGANQLESAAAAVNQGGKDIQSGLANAKSAFEDSKEDGKTKQGLSGGSQAVASGAKEANAGVKELVKSVQSTPDSMDAQVEKIIAQVNAVTGGAISSKAALNATVEGINQAVAQGAELNTVLSEKGLNAEAYLKLSQAYYSIQTLESVKTQLQSFVDSKSDDMKELLVGMQSLQDGSAQISSGVAQLYSGISQLYAGAGTLTDGTTKMSVGMKNLTTGTSGIKGGAAKMSAATSSLAGGTKTLSAGTGEMKKGTTTLKNGVKQLVGGASELAEKIGDASPKIQTGIGTIAGATTQVNNGAATLSKGAGTLDSGVAELVSGAVDLNDGALKLNEEGIRKITNIFGKDAKEAAKEIEDMIQDGKDYKSFSGINNEMTGSVRFILKTEEIKAEK